VSGVDGGSLLNPIEIPPEVQTFLASQVRDDSEIEVLFVESRAEYVTKDNLARIIPQLGSKKLVLGVGLESISEHVRNGNIRKGLPLSVYGSALTTAHAAGAGVRTYVLLKPYGLTDSEAIAETVATVRAAFDMGSDEVSVEAAFVAPGSPLHRSFEDGNYCPPSLWSVVEVIRATTGFGPVYLGQFTDSPPPIAIPDSCPKCSHALRDCLDHYRATLDRATLDGLPDCECRKQIR
jgi:radical SAM enzyme (TIGR01210 family)